jgi:hypothetical protein
VALETFANIPLGVVSGGGTTAPAAGTVESWTVTASAAFPAAVTDISQFHVADTAPAAGSEIILVTAVSGTSWTVTRGAEGTVPVAHPANFTVSQVVTAAFLTREPDVSIGRLVVCGHSYPAGYGATEGGQQWPQRLAASLHAELVTYVHSTAVLAVDDAASWPGGYASVLNGIRPRTSSTSVYADRTASPYIPLSPITIFEYGLNDLTYLTSNVTTNIAWFKVALRALCCVARAGGIFRDTHASVAFGGSGGSHWTANTTQPQYGSPTNHKTTTLNDTVTITVPADFPGGEVDILTLAWAVASNAGGAKWSTTVDGGAAQVLDGTGAATGAVTGHANLVVQRLAGLAPGAHTIVMTLLALDASAVAYFDSWMIASTSFPLVVLCTEMANCPAFPMTTTGAHTPITTSDVTALNVAVRALATEFTDGMVISADVDAYFGAAAGYTPYGQPGSLYFSDNFHPNSAGHGVICQSVRDGIRGSTLSVLPPGSTWRGMSLYALSGLIMRQVLPAGGWGWPNGGDPVFGTGWSVYAGGAVGAAPIGSGAYFTRGPDNETEIVASLVNTSSPAAGSVIFTLPPGYGAETPKWLDAVSWNAGQTVPSAAAVGVLPNGNVVWYSGTPAVRLDIYGSFKANALGF